MDITQWIIAGVALTSLLAGGLGFLSSSRKDSIIKILTKDNVATKDYNKTLETEVTKLTAERDGFRTQSDNYKELAQGSPQLKQLTAAIENQTTVLSVYFGKQEERNETRQKRTRSSPRTRS